MHIRTFSYLTPATTEYASSKPKAACSVTVTSGFLVILTFCDGETRNKARYSGSRAELAKVKPCF